MDSDEVTSLHLDVVNFSSLFFSPWDQAKVSLTELVVEPVLDFINFFYWFMLQFCVFCFSLILDASIHFHLVLWSCSWYNWMEAFLHFLLYVFKATNLPLHTTLAASYKFWCVFIFIQLKILSHFLFELSSDPWGTRHVSLSFQMFGNYLYVQFKSTVVSERALHDTDYVDLLRILENVLFWEKLHAPLKRTPFLLLLGDVFYNIH